MFMLNSIPVEARTSTYQGPTQTQVELSEGDKKYIVEIYSKGDLQVFVCSVGEPPDSLCKCLLCSLHLYIILYYS